MCLNVTMKWAAPFSHLAIDGLLNLTYVVHTHYKSQIVPQGIFWNHTHLCMNIDFYRLRNTGRGYCSPVICQWWMATHACDSFFVCNIFPFTPYIICSVWMPDTDWSPGMRCLQFYYHMAGSSVGTLAALRSWKHSKDTMTLWQRSGHQGDDWREAHLEVLLYGFNIQVSAQGRGHAIA